MRYKKLQKEGFEHFIVYEDGRVYNEKTKNFIIGDINNCGYQRVRCTANGKSIRFFRHRIVAELFIDNENNLPVVNHLDGNKNNNHYSNLEWCTSQENEIHKQLFLYPKKTNKKFIMTDTDGNEVTYNSQSEFISEYPEISQSSLSRWIIKGFCNRGKFNKYKFSFCS